MPESTSPMDEAARLNALSGLHLLDTPPEERFDRLTRLAQHLLRVPIALISLIDTDRVWFKSAQGLALKQVSLDVSFCTHAHANQGLFEVADARNDPRFAGNPLVTGDPHIRFYASCPIVAPDGTPIGVLCVADRTPSGLTDGDRQALRDLTEMVNQELRLGSGVRRAWRPSSNTCRSVF
ncbi:MAG: GAF domain-containing protein [Candidatus Sericytochromatia bacterium]|nr:GAF domain-containing protein [Candidatus Sericytochromatia bacterium]